MRSHFCFASWRQLNFIFKNKKRVLADCSSQNLSYLIIEIMINKCKGIFIRKLLLKNSCGQWSIPNSVLYLSNSLQCVTSKNVYAFLQKYMLRWKDSKILNIAFKYIYWHVLELSIYQGSCTIDSTCVYLKKGHEEINLIYLSN